MSYRPNQSLLNTQPSYDLPTTEQFSPTEDDRLALLKKENYELMKSLGLYDSVGSSSKPTTKPQRTVPTNQTQEQESFMSPVNRSDLNLPRYMYGNNDSTQKTSVPQTPEVTGQYDKKPKKNMLSLDLKRLSSPVEVPKKQVDESTANNSLTYPVVEDIGYKEGIYFPYSDFDDYVTSQSKPLRQADVRNRVLELQNLAQSMKAIIEDPSEKKVTDVLKRFAEYNIADKKPFYQQVSERAPTLSYSVRATSQQVNTSIDKSPTSIKKGTYDERKAVPNNSNYESERHSDKNSESFEAFLYDQGVAPALFNQNARESAPGKQAANIPGLDNQGGNEVPDLLDPKAVAAFLEGVSNPIHSTDLVSSLQFFLLQNLREVSEIKDLLRNEDSSPATRAFGRSKSRTRPKQKSVERPVTLPLDENEDNELEKKLQAQTDRLIKNLQAANKRIEELEAEKKGHVNMEQILNRSIKTGEVKVSYVRFDLDISQVTLEDLNDEFEFEKRLLVVNPTSLSFGPYNPSKEEDQAPRNQEHVNEIPLNNIEHIVYLEKPGSNVFFIKMVETVKEKPKPQDPRRLAPPVKSGFADNGNKPEFYIVQVENQQEVLAWDLAFFLVNFRILTKNVQFYWNKKEFLQSLKMFLNKYADFNGENSLIFSEGGHQVNGKPPLHPLATFGQGRDASKFDAMPDPLQEASRNQTPGMVNVTLKVHEMMKTNNDPKPDIRINRNFIQKVNQKKASLVDDDPAESDEVRSNISQITPESERFGVASIDEGGITEDIKSSRSLRSNNTTKKKTITEIEEVFTKYLRFLMEGVTFEKYGKWGTKREKLIRVSGDFTGVEWLDPMKPNKVPDFIMIDSIMRIESGSRSQFFQKKRMGPEELNLCFTILSNEKNLNLRAPDTRRRDVFVEALQYIMNDKTKLKKMAEIAKSMKEKAG